MLSVDIFLIGIGPSSSHTVGQCGSLGVSWRAGEVAGERAADEVELRARCRPPAWVTGRGSVIRAPGFAPDTPDPEAAVLWRKSVKARFGRGAADAFDAALDIALDCYIRPHLPPRLSCALSIKPGHCYQKPITRPAAGSSRSRLSSPPQR